MNTKRKKVVDKKLYTDLMLVVHIAPEWFTETCKRIDDYMLSEGFKTLISINYLTADGWIFDSENLDTVDELEDYPIGLARRIKLEFKNIK